MNSIGQFRFLSSRVEDNLSVIRLHYFIYPILLLLAASIGLYFLGVNSIETYIEVQRNLFYDLNSALSNYSSLQANLTELGDVIVFLPFLAILMVFAPEFWKSVLIGLLICGLFSNILKRLFGVPRPAGVFENDSFIIIGNALSGNTSMPSGHAIATFTIMTVLLFAFMPKEKPLRLLWWVFILTTGILIVLSRIGVGAHYPMDVIFGIFLGNISGLMGICINQRYAILHWVTKVRYYPVSIILFSITAMVLLQKILILNTTIFYFSLISILVTISVIFAIYVKRES